MKISELIQSKLRLPVIGSPMFIASTKDLVVEQCRNGIIGTFPALNARPQETLVDWITEIRERLSQAEAVNHNGKIAPFGINQLMGPLNNRWEADLKTIVDAKVPIIITSLRAPPKEIVDEVHRYGGLVFHDITNLRHARKAASMGVDGLILVAAGAGGQGGDRSPFALINEVKQFFEGLIILAGSISTGQDILGAQAMGADFAYLGTRFLAAKESGAAGVHKQEILESCAEDIIYANSFTGIYGNYLKPSLIKAGFDVNDLPEFSTKTSKYSRSSTGEIKVWKDIRGCGHGCGSVKVEETVSAIVGQLEDQYQEAWTHLSETVFKTPKSINQLTKT